MKNPSVPVDDKAKFCWNCGTSITKEPSPLSTYAECQVCRAQLHCCRQCQHFNPQLRTDCEEPMAESHSEREKANFCDWFKLRPSFSGQDEITSLVDNRAELKMLFGTNGSIVQAPSDSRRQLDDLFAVPSDDS